MNSSTSITASTPAIAQDSTYYVVVTTAPGGTSTNGPGAPVFTFAPLTPVVASVNPTNGGTTHAGTSVTLTGIGFVSGTTTVQLVPTGTGTTLTATNVVVTASTTLTATIPTGGTNGRTYYVEVTTTTGGAELPARGLWQRWWRSHLHLLGRLLRSTREATLWSSGLTAVRRPSRARRDLRPWPRSLIVPPCMEG